MAKVKTRGQQVVPVSRLRVDRDSQVHITRQADPNERWDADDTCTNWNVERLYLISIDGDGDVIADFAVSAGDLLYLVYAVYSTGNSFGSDTNAAIDFISVHRTEEQAKAVQQVLRDKKSKYDKRGNFDWTALIPLDSGVIFPYHCPWLGYFESLTDVYVKSFVVEAR